MKTKKDMKPEALTWAFKIGGKYVDATPYKQGSLLQYCSCPGRKEVAAVGMGEFVRGPCKGYALFSVIPNILPKSYQVTLQYGDNSKESERFFKERGIQREDVGTSRMPALKRKNVK